MHKSILILKSLFILFLLFYSGEVFSSKTSINEEQPSLPYKKVKLDDLKEFKRVKGKQWSIHGSVFMDRHQKLHALGSAGNGVLLGNATASKRNKLISQFEHGDIDIELDFMLSNGAHSGMFLQERYKIELNDSWNNKTPSTQECGSIAGTDKNNTSKGTAPGLNACKAPGLWQHLSIRFKAPRFDAQGNKVKDAEFVEVKLNGEVIHKNLKVSAPSYSSGLNDEKELASLVFTGEEGAIAFKNISYKIYNDSESVKLSNISFDVYKGLFKKYDTLNTITPLRSGKSDSLTWRVGDRKAQMVISGNMDIPREGDYLFELKAGGAAWLLIDNKEVLSNNNTRDYTRSFYGKVNLTKGNHQFKVIYSNSDESLVLKYEGPQLSLSALTTPASERKVHESKPFEVVVKDKSIYQRGFTMHKGKINPYVISVGIPGGLNYAYDLTTYNIINAWKGRFLDVSNMWTQRGESQKEIPLGAPVEFNKGVFISQIKDPSDKWTDSVIVENSPFPQRGYHINDKGIPVFQYTFQDLKLEDYISSDTNKDGITRQLKVEGNNSSDGIYFMLGSGTSIEKLSNGDYAVNDKEYYIESVKGINEQKLVIAKTKEGQYQLLLPLSSSDKSLLFNYTIVW